MRSVANDNVEGAGPSFVNELLKLCLICLRTATDGPVDSIGSLRAVLVDKLEASVGKSLIEAIYNVVSIRCLQSARVACDTVSSEE